MKITILNIFKYLSIVLLASALVGCGGKSSASVDDDNTTVNDGGNNDGNTGGGTEDTPVSTSLSGNGVDGPIYGSTIRVYNMSTNTNLDNETPLMTLTKATSDGIDGTEYGKDGQEIGDFSLAVDDLPDNFIVRLTGGFDAGDDGVADDRDEVSNFDLTSIGSKANANKIYITPATSLILEKYRENSNIDSAKASVAKTFGLGDGEDLSALNPKSNEKASRAAKIVANIVKILPISDNETSDALQAVAGVLNDDNISVYNGVSYDLNDVNLSQIVDDLNSADVNSKKDIIVNIEDKLKEVIVEQVSESKPVEDLNSSTRNDAYASEVTIKATQKLLKEATSTDDVDNAKVTSVVSATKEAINSILDSNDSVLDKDNIEDMLEVVENNADKNMTALTTNLVNLAQTKQDLANASDDVKQLAQEMITNIDLNNTNGVNAITSMLEDTSLANALGDGVDIELLAQTLTSKVNSEGNVSISDVDDTVTQLSDTSVTTALDDLDTIISNNEGNTTVALIVSWMKSSIALNLEQNISISSDMDNFYTSIETKYGDADTNQTKLKALEIRVLVNDLNGSESVDDGTLGTFETGLSSLISNTYDQLTSLECALNEAIIEDKKDNGFADLSTAWTTCINARPAKAIVVPDNLFTPMELLEIDGIPSNDIEENIIFVPVL